MKDRTKQQVLEWIDVVTKEAEKASDEASSAQATQEGAVEEVAFHEGAINALSALRAFVVLPLDVRGGILKEGKS